MSDDKKLDELAPLAQVPADALVYGVQSSTDYNLTKANLLRRIVVADNAPARTWDNTDLAVYAVVNSGTPVARTIPADTTLDFPLGTVIGGVQIGTAAVTIDGEPGVTITELNGNDTTQGQGGEYVARKIGPDAWLLKIDESSGPPVILSRLTAEYLAKGATEVWPLEDISGGGVAVNNAAHDLLELNGSNLTYEQPLIGFPGLNGIKFPASGDPGDKTFLASQETVPDLRTLGDTTQAFIIRGASLTPVNSFIGMSAAPDGTPVTNGNYGAGIVLNDSALVGPRYLHFYGNNNAAPEAVSQFNLCELNNDYLVVVTRNAAARTIDYYVNGAFFGSDNWLAVQDPDGGGDSFMVVGRDLDDYLNDAVGVDAVISHVGTFKQELGPLDVSDIMNVAVDAVVRAGGNFDDFILASSASGSVGEGSDNELTMWQPQTGNTVTVNVNGVSLAIGESSYHARWGQGDVDFVTGGSITTIVGPTSISTQGAIMRVTRTSATEATLTEI